MGVSSSISDVLAQAGKLRCELSYRRCETSVEELLDMIRVEVRVAIRVNPVQVEELENIQKEVDNNAITLNDVAERLFSLNSFDHHDCSGWMRRTRRWPRCRWRT